MIIQKKKKRDPQRGDQGINGDPPRSLQLLSLDIEYDGEASRGVDSTTASDSHGRGERSLGKPVRIQERQINTTRWNICIKAMMRKKVPDYLLRMIDDYLSDRWVTYKGDKWSFKEEMTCGASQGSRVGPLVWNVIYDGFLHLTLPAGTSIIGFVDDVLIVCAAEDVRILELRINENLWRAKRWLDSRGLKMTPDKTEALPVTDRRSFQYLGIVLGEHEVKWKTSIKYLGVQLDRRLSFGEHLQIATAKAIQCGAKFTWLMPNTISGFKESAASGQDPAFGYFFQQFIFELIVYSIL